jgi:hypothetical protein
MPRQNPHVKRQLDEWYLKRVPFPSVSYVSYASKDPLINGSVFARELRERELNQIRHELLLEGFPQQVKRWNWIWARKNMGNSLGMGKTALMAYVCDQINKDFGESFFGHAANWLALYVPVQPGTRTMDDIAAFALDSFCDDARGYSLEQRLVARLRHRVIVQNRSRQYPSNLAGIVWHRFLSDAWLTQQGIARATLDADVEQLLQASRVSPKVAKALATGNLRDYLVSLNGSPHLIPVNTGFRTKALGILLNDIACAAAAAMIAKLTILLDDFYFVVRALQPAEREPIAAKVRKVAVDGPYESVKQQGLFNWIAVMHTQTAHTFEDAWKKAGMNTHAPLRWEDRDNPSVVLRGFSVQQGGVLLREYLRAKVNRLPQASSEVYPFTESALDAIAQAVGERDQSPGDNTIVPRGLLDTAYYIFATALSRQVQGPLDPNFVAHVINGTPLPAQPTADDEMEEADSEELQPAVGCPCGCHEDGPGAVFDVMAVLSGSGNARRKVRHYCQNCNEAIIVEAVGG